LQLSKFLQLVKEARKPCSVRW